MKKRKKSSKAHRNRSAWPGLLVLLALVVAIVAILALKQKPAPVEAAIGGENAQQALDLPETMLAQALAAGKPTVAFYHFNNCDSCIQMIKVVQQVYGEFVNSVVLVDVNVYHQDNQPLLERERISFIPTLIFYDRTGERTVFVGVMQPDQFRDRLLEISGGK